MSGDAWNPPYMLANTPEEFDRARRAAMQAHRTLAADRQADQERRQALTGLRDEVVAGVERARVLDVLVSLYDGARENSWQEAADLAELVSGDPWNDVDPIRFRDWLSERLA